MTREEKRELKRLQPAIEKLCSACASLRSKLARAGGSYQAQSYLSEAQTKVLGAASVIDNQIQNDFDPKSAGARTLELPFK